ncbi:MAG: DEAD/DEAH box helicase [Lachnospiraceae bacterium]
MSFNALGMDAPLVAGLQKEHRIHPTDVQEKSIPLIMAGQSIAVQSETGSGKTLAYLLPLFMKLKPYQRGTVQLILVPTHELAMQVHRQIRSLAEHAGVSVHSTPIVGNVNIRRQIDYLKEKPQIVVGTPGRILELIKKRKIPAHALQTLVLDEVDKLLDADNLDTVQAVIKCCMRDIQLLMYSASIPKSAEQTILTIRSELQILRLSSKAEMPKNLKHYYILADSRRKTETLRRLLSTVKKKKAIAFINKTFEIEETLQKLQYHHHPCAALYGGASKQDRQKTIAGYKRGDFSLLLASDIAARGLHFENVSTIFHVSIPEEPLIYLHRAGRAGRRQKWGVNIAIVTPKELSLLKQYEKALGIHFEEMK